MRSARFVAARGQSLSLLRQRRCRQNESGKTCEEHASLCEPHPCARSFGVSIMMHVQASMSFKPRVGTLDHPAFGQHFHGLLHWPKRLLWVVPLPARHATNDLHVDRLMLRNQRRRSARISRIGKQRLDRLTGFSLRLRQGCGCGVAVLNRSTAHYHRQDQPQRLNHQVTLAPFDLLARIKALIPALRRDTRGLRVNDRRTGLQRPFDPLPPLLSQSILQLLEFALSRPAGERLLHGMPRGKYLGRQCSPRTARTQHKAAGVNHSPTIMQRRSSSCAGCQLKDVLRQRPLGVGQTTGKAASLTTVRLSVAIALNDSRITPINLGQRRFDASEASVEQRALECRRTDAVATVRLPLSLEFVLCGIWIGFHQRTQARMLALSDEFRAADLRHNFASPTSVDDTSLVYYVYTLQKKVTKEKATPTIRSFPAVLASGGRRRNRPNVAPLGPPAAALLGANPWAPFEPILDRFAIDRRKTGCEEPRSRRSHDDTGSFIASTHCRSIWPIAAAGIRSLPNSRRQIRPPLLHDAVRFAPSQTSSALQPRATRLRTAISRRAVAYCDQTLVICLRITINTLYR